MAGNVHVLNVTSEQLDLVLNGQAPPCGTIPGWSFGPADRYRPSLGAVPRTLNASDGYGKFVNGTNQVVMRREAGAAQALVTIDGRSLPIGQDLLLLVERNQWQLVDSSAAVVASGNVNDSG